MGYDYDALYGAEKDALGPPTKIVTDFFRNLGASPQRILDVGCGQGRDALAIARMGHSVVGVDISENGIADMMIVALRETLDLCGEVADITTYTAEGYFDVVLFDRTLHMLPEEIRLHTLTCLLGNVADKGRVLILDETSNLPAFQNVFDSFEKPWIIEEIKRGCLTARLA